MSKEKTTYYPEVAPNPDFVALEKEVLSFWERERVFQASVENRPTKTAEGASNAYVFYDGPPFANGLPHYGHLLTGYVKDVIARYHTMKGKRVERRFGWDCHGLPAEMESEKQLGISGRQKIMEFGIDKFNEHCRTSVMRYRQEWRNYVTRQARWVDFENDYKTMDLPYMESVIWAFKQLYDKGLVYESYRVMPYSWGAETVLSNFETRLDNATREKEDKAVTVAFELEEVPDFVKEQHAQVKICKLLAWTTTPWTLPSNLALALHPNFIIVGHLEEDVCYLASQKAINALFHTDYNVGMLREGEDIYDRFDKLPPCWTYGKSLIGIHYKPLFPYFADHPNAFRILDGSSFIEEESGTGVVHMAPAFGEDDQKCCEANGIRIVCPVDEKGRYTAEIFDLPYEPDDGSRPPLEGGQIRFANRGGYSEVTQEKAKELRKNLTEAERKLWDCLRGKKLEQYRFRRQQPIGNYIADFFCPAAKLVIEVDGGQHGERVAYDEERTRYLEKAGYRVLRFWNNEVTQNIEGVVQKISEALNTPPDSLRSSAPPQGVGGSKWLRLAGLNVIAETQGKSEDEPYTESQLKKYGLANLRIIDYLKHNGHHIKQEDYKHNYPHCWRTDTPIIYRAVPSWYVEVTKFKQRAVELNRKVNWIPAHVRDGAMGHMLETAPDWSISRNRFWGCPIPVWRSDNPENKELYVFGSLKELEDFFGVPVKDLHRPYIDQLTKPDPQNPQYTIRRVEEVLDCWFESGSMPFAQVHYPFENKDWFEQNFPADFITEYIGQTRGWFNTLMMLGTAIFDSEPFENCICHGIVIDDETGLKYSKRLKNYKDPMEVFDKFGSDALRWMMISSGVMRGADLGVDPEGAFIRDVVRLHIKPIWNAYNFFTLYANADSIKAEFRTDSSNPMDRYILAKCAQMVQTIEASMDAYDTPSACEAITRFIEVLNNWYIRRSRPRFWKAEKDADKQSAYHTLYTVLLVLCRAGAPLLPLTLEAVYRGLNSQMESVHLQNFPSQVIQLAPGTEALMKAMDRVQEICATAHAIRNTENIRTRQPLDSLTVYRSGLAGDIEYYASLIADETNVKTVHFLEALEEVASLKLKINFPVAGKRLGARMKEVGAAAKAGKWERDKKGFVHVGGELMQPAEYELLLESKIAKGAQALSSNDALVVLDVNLTPELEQEGLARDVVRLIQQTRKDAGFDVSDHIHLSFYADSLLKVAIEAHGAYVAEQTLAEKIIFAENPTGEKVVTQALEGSTITLALTRKKATAA